MSSCVLSLFLLALFSSIAVTDPTGVKVRLARRSDELMKDTALAVLKALVNVPLPDMTIPYVSCTIKEFTPTDIRLNRNRILVNFLDTGIRFDIKEFGITGNFYTDVLTCIGGTRDSPNTVTADGLSATITAKFENSEGRLVVNVHGCNVNVEQIRTAGLTGGLIGQVVHYFLESKFCPYLNENIIPALNTLLTNHNMVMELPNFHNIDNLHIFLDYSLSGVISHQSHSVDVPLKGEVFAEPRTEDSVQNVPPGTFPCITDDALMAYVGVSDFFFNTAAVAAYQTKSLEREQQPLKLTDPTYDTLEISELPTISLSQKKGITVNVRPRLRASSGPTKGQAQQFLSLSAVCQGEFHVNIIENRLTLPAVTISCSIVTKNKFRDQLGKMVTSHLNSLAETYLQSLFGEGLPVPLPTGVTLSRGTISYCDGFMVVGGDVALSADLLQNITNSVRTMLTRHE